MQVLPSTHNSPESAYVINDYPFGRKLRCFKRVWVERTNKGSKKGCFRVMEQTTKREVNYIKDQYETAPVDKPELWNKPKAGRYGLLKILYIDPETGYVERSGLMEFPWNEHILKFNAMFGEYLDEFQKSILQPYLLRAEYALEKENTEKAAS